MRIFVKTIIILLGIVLLNCNTSLEVTTRTKSSPEPIQSEDAQVNPTVITTNTPSSTFTHTHTQTSTTTPSTTTTPSEIINVVIPANVVWIFTGATLDVGNHIVITATGKSNISGLPDNDIWEPDGDGGHCQLDCLLPEAAYGTLIGKIEIKGKPFIIGSFLQMDVKEKGKLLMAINDNAPYYFDNTGFYRVIITIWR